MSDATWPTVYEQIIRKNARHLSDDAPLLPGMRLENVGIDSLATVSLLIEVEQAFGVTLPDAALREETFETVGSLWSIVAELSPGLATPHAASAPCTD